MSSAAEVPARDELVARIVGAIARARDVSVEAIDVERTFADQGIDSFEALSVLFAVEEELDVTMPDQAREVKTVLGLVELARTLLGESSETPPPAECVAARPST